MLSPRGSPHRLPTVSLTLGIERSTGELLPSRASAPDPSQLHKSATDEHPLARAVDVFRREG